MIQDFEEYEQHLQMFIDYGADAHARHLVGEPVKPEGYDEYKAAQEQLPLQKQKKAAQKIQKPIENYEVKGYLFDAEGVPQYLTADDHYNGIENPEWTKKHTKIETKPYAAKDENTSEQSLENKIKNGGWHNYDEDGVPEFLNYDDRYNGVVNPEWEKKQGKKD